MSSPDDPTIDEIHVAKLNLRELEEAEALFSARRARRAEESAVEAAPAATAKGEREQDEIGPQRPEESFGQAVLRNISPLAAIGGALQGAFAEPIRMGHEMDQAMGLPRVVIGGDEGPVSLQWPGEADPEMTADELVPDVGPDGFAKGVGQFLGGFAGAGKMLKPIQALQKIGQSGRFGAGALAATKGAIADFASFDGMSNPINGLVQMFPDLEGPVTEFMDSDQEDPALLQRLKSALVGVIPGAAVDTVLAGVRAGRAYFRSKPAIEAADQAIKQAETVMTDQKAKIGELLGNPDDAAFAGQADEATTGPRPNEGNRVGDIFVNWARVDSEDDVKYVLGEMANRYSDSIDAARGGAYESFEKVKLDALETDAARIIEERRASNKAVPLPAAEMLAVRNLWVASGRKLRDLTRRVNANAGPMEKLAFRKQLDTHAMIQNVFVGARTATARAQSAMRIPAGDAADWTMGMEGAIAQLDSGMSTEQIAAGLGALEAMGRGDAAANFVDLAAKYGAAGSEMVKQAWYFALLSSVYTHARNISGNTAMLAGNAMARKGANVLGQIMGEENVAAGEATAKLFGDLEGIRAAFSVDAKLRAAQNVPETANLLQRFWAAAKATPVGQAVVEGRPGFGIGKPEAKQIGAFDPSRLNIDPDSMLGRGMRLTDAITSSSSRGLMGEDEVFKMANYRSELNALAVRQATREADEGMIAREAIPDRVAALVNEPSTAMRLAAMKEAGLATFTNQPINTPYWQLSKAIQGLPVVGRIALPFRRTPYNIFIENFQWNPAFAPLTKRWRDDFAAGGARADIAVSKLALGGMMLVEMARWATEGKLRGEGGDLSRTPEQRETEERAGLRPATLMIGDRTFSFRGMEPISTHMGFASNLVDLMQSDEFGDEDRDLDDLAIASAAAIASSLQDASFVRGFSDLVEVVNNPMQAAEGYSENLFGSMVPNISRQVAQNIDPTEREVTTMFEAALAKVPWASRRLAAKTDAWGREKKRESGLGKTYDAVSPFYSKPVDPEPIDSFLYENEIWIGKPQKDVSFDGITINLRNKPEIFRDLVKLRGQEVRSLPDGSPITTGAGYVSEGGNLLEELNAIVSGTHGFSPVFQMGSPGAEGDQAEFIKGIVRAFGDEAKHQLLDKHPGLKVELRTRADEAPARRFKRARENQFLGE